MEDAIISLFVFLMTIAVFINWVVVIYLRKENKEAERESISSYSLKERFFNSIVLSTSNTAILVLGFNRAFHLGFHPTLVLLGFTLALLVNSLFPVYWLWLYTRRKF